MNLLLLFAQLAAVSASASDSVYSTPALREFVAAAAAANHTPPPELRGYQARIETELSFILRDTLGRERAEQIEQLESDAHWARGGDYDVHVLGYRSENIGAPFSALSIVDGWTVPVLYGERLLMGVEFGDADDRERTVRGRRGEPETIVAVHPFAADRDSFYRFSGGDTITVLRAGSRSIPIVLVRVTPHLRDTTKFAAFDGEIEVDATRHQIVRMRGRFVILRPNDDRPLILRTPGVVAVAFAEFVNAEIDGTYWLPAFERTEFQASFALFGTNRSVFRIVSRFRDFVIDSTGVAGTGADDGQRIRSRVTWAPPDSVNRFGAWDRDLGAATTSVGADDFLDLAPDVWRKQGRPRVDLAPTKMSDVLRFNRVEGLYTGLSGTLRFRDLAPGVAASADAGWAWTERAVRGGARVSVGRGNWTYDGRIERRLVSTNDFVIPFTGGDAFSALLGSIDDEDYVDRRLAVGAATRVIGSIDRALVTVEGGYGEDRPEIARLTQGIFLGVGPFRPNRFAAPGRYELGAVDLELHPNVTGDFVEPGLGGRLHYEAAAGQIGWQRAELSLAARAYRGPVAFGAHADAGALLGASIPPQQLFEIGGNDALPGYAYKQFAGDRAALLRGFANYSFPVLRTPWRVWRNYIIPGLSPGFGAGIQAGWAAITSPESQTAVDQLGAGWSSQPVSTATNGVRATVRVGATLFSGTLHIGLARPIDHAAPWGFSAGFGENF